MIHLVYVLFEKHDHLREFSLIYLIFELYVVAAQLLSSFDEKRDKFYISFW